MKLQKITLIIFSLFILISCSKNNSTEPQNNLDPNPSVKEKLNEFTNNYIENSDMENGSNDYWSGGYTANYSYSYSTEESHTSSHSLKVSAESPESGQFAFWAQTISASDLVGKKLIASVSVKFNDLSGDGVALAIRGDNSDVPSGSAEIFNSTQNKIVKSGSSDWQTLDISLDNVPGEIKSITIYMLLISQTGNVYFDDLSLATTKAAEPSYKLQNTDFETGISYPENWWQGATNYNSFQINYVDNVSLSSSHSTKISSSGSNSNFAFWAQTILADQFVGKSAELKVNLKGQNISGDGIAIAIRGDDTQNPRSMAEIFSTTQGNQQISGTFDWQTYSVNIDAIPENIKSITIYLIYLPNTSGTIYFDDVAME
jgi:hypothetical protein